MKYLSTRGGEKDLTFKNILFSGLASDGGLYVPCLLYTSDAADE